MTRALPDLVLPASQLVVWTDLHLRPEVPEEILAFASQIDAVDSETVLLLLGDLFDAWTGPETVRAEEFASLRTALAGRAATGGRTILLRGNRDVLMQPSQGRALGFELADRVLWNGSEGPVLFSHGDEYCLRDHPYQRLRRTLRRPSVRGLLRLLPARARAWAGRRLRSRSQEAVSRKPLDVLALDLSAAQRALAQLGAERAVIGHLHVAAEHALEGSRSLQVLPAWEPAQSPWTGHPA
ncbi:MAG: hypothetical protein MK209_03830 [Planctomycetes bacterium]|nr:hypothetical protein [Planctomycetota bacterium]